MAISMAVFGGATFDQASMIRAIDRRPYRPSMIQDVIGFEPVRATTDTVYIVGRKRYLNLIRTTVRGAPIEMAAPEDKDARPLRIPRIAKGDKLFAHELANIMPLEDESETDRAAAEVARKQEKLIDDTEATFELQALGALKGTILDTNGDTLVNFFTEFGIAPPSDIDLTLDNAAMTIGELREKIGTLLTIPIARASGAGNDPRFRIKALCGDNFWFKITGHPAVEKTFLNQAASAELRDEKLWTSFIFCGVEWIHYRGTDDGTTMTISTNKAHVFPVGVPGMWQHVMGPGNEFMHLIGQPGRRYYPFLEKDQSEKFQWVQPEIYSYPLFVNARPDLVLTATV
jgi:Phage major capsid protein E